MTEPYCNHDPAAWTIDRDTGRTVCECGYVVRGEGAVLIEEDPINRITAAFNQNLVDTGALGARRAASAEIARMVRARDRLETVRANLRHNRGRILALAGEFANPTELINAAGHISLALANLAEFEATHDNV